jgi:MoxR-like ATPase
MTAGQSPHDHQAHHDSRLIDAPDRRDGLVYVLTPEIELAVDVALATGRPLLLRGEPGSGKSSLAAFIAQDRAWRYYEHVVTSRTQARDLLWAFDTVRRLADAQTRPPGTSLNDSDYIEPGVLWWAFAPQSARRRGAPPGDARAAPAAAEPGGGVNAGRSQDHAVVLIDEIDKADPDLPNGLLVPLASNEFLVTETRELIRKEAPENTLDPRFGRHLIVITTNEERELPNAFLRRCIVTWLPHPSAARLAEIARAHLASWADGMSAEDEQLAEDLAHRVEASRAEAARLNVRPPSTAEYLDAVRACRTLGIVPGSDRWDQLRDLALVKHQQPG